MKTKLLVVGLSIVIVVLAAIIVVPTIMRHCVDTSFATEVSIRYYYVDKEIDVVITDLISKTEKHLKPY